MRGPALVILLLVNMLALSACGAGRDRAAVRLQTRPLGPSSPATTALTPPPTPSPPVSSTVAAPVCRPAHSTGDFVESLELSGSVRTFRVHVPPAYDASHRTPLVVNFHGYDRTAADQEAYSQLVPLADRETFILVSPQAAGDPPEWEVLDVYPDRTLADVQFTRALVAHLQAEYCIDPARIFATGMSNGAEMASQVACLLPGTFAAVAAVAGAVYQDGRCDGPPVAIIAFHGTDDGNVPFATVPPAMAGWAVHNGCDPIPPAPDPISQHVSREAYVGCGAADVVLYVIDGGGHTWPGAPGDFPNGGAGPTTHEIAASDLIWAFFADHPR